MRLKDADALLEYFMINLGWHDADGIEVDDSDKKRAIIKDWIDGVPTIDAAPVVHGQWTEEEVWISELAHIDAWQSAKCSVCGKYHTTPYMYYFEKYKFCPNCGAKMDGGDNDGPAT